jgi:mRNA-degrading endonuclease RelE of RelBE toxin-antitoxin system
MPWFPREIVASPGFQRNVKQLRKKYAGVDAAVWKTLVEQLGPNPTIGIPLRGFSHRVYKLRVANPSAGRGKRGGYRLIYDWNPTTAILVLLILYTHDEKDDVLAAAIARARREGMP